ncbi:MAG TPA: nucleotidyltransferase domain-containing protein [Bacteroidales bacterium]|nr:nucleotidyltransferase domain-containing protein [Bacteroidales bacterium]
MTKRENILSLVKNRIKEIDPDSRILLFGSRARGESHPDSDWDFLILSNRTVDRDFQNRIYDTLFEAELETDEVLTGVVQNLTIWDDLKMTSFYQNVLQEGIEC